MMVSNLKFLYVFLCLTILPIVSYSQISLNSQGNDTCYNLFKNLRVSDIDDMVIQKVPKMGIIATNRLLRRIDSLYRESGSLTFKLGTFSQYGSVAKNFSAKQKSLFLSILLDPSNYLDKYKQNGIVYSDGYTDCLDIDFVIGITDSTKQLTSFFMLSSTCKNFLYIDRTCSVKGVIWMNRKAWEKLDDLIKH